MVIVVGGNGFIGSHFVEYCEINKIDFVKVVRNVDGGFTINDLLFSEQGLSLIERATSLVYAVSSSVPGSNLNALQEEFSNAVSNAVELFQRISLVNPSCKIIFLSSGGQIYGRVSKYRPISEDCPVSPASPYALGKLCVESTLAFLYQNYSQRYAILRVSNPVGGHQNNKGQGVFAAIYKALETDSVFMVYGDGSTIRDYFDVDELCEAISMVIDDHSDCNLYNVSSGQGVSLNEVFQEFEAFLGKKLKLNMVNARSVDIPYSVLDSSKISSEIGWSSSLKLTQLVEKFCIIKNER